MLGLRDSRVQHFGFLSDFCFGSGYIGKSVLHLPVVFSNDRMQSLDIPVHSQQNFTVHFGIPGDLVLNGSAAQQFKHLDGTHPTSLRGAALATSANSLRACGTRWPCKKASLFPPKLPPRMGALIFSGSSPLNVSCW